MEKKLSIGGFIPLLYHRFTFLLLLVMAANTAATAVGLGNSFQPQTASQVIIAGLVTNSDGEPLPGVGVTVKGTSFGVSTNIDGRFSISTMATGTLVFSYLGMVTQEAPIEGRRFINITLQSADVRIDEVVVVGYGSAKRATTTGAVVAVDEKRLQTAQVSNLSTALQGVSSGVQVITTTGQPGSTSSINIRGAGSLSSSNQPLIVVDGVPYDANLSTINPSDVKSMTILKDAASASIYGSRAANGVIVVTTNLGEKDRKPYVEIRSTYGVSNRAVSPIKLASTNTYMELQWESLRNGYMDNGNAEVLASEKASNELLTWIGINPYGPKNVTPVGVNGKLKAGLSPLWDDNWDREIIGDGVRWELNASVRGGGNNTQYYLSVGNLDEKGMMLGSGFTRKSVRLNLSNATTSWLKTDSNISFSSSTIDFNDSQDSNVSNGANYGLSMPRYYPIYQRSWDTGAYILDANGNKKYDYGNYRTSSFKTSNLIDQLSKTIDRAERNLFSFRGSAELNLGKMLQLASLQGLKLKSSLSTDYNFYNSKGYNPSFTAVGLSDVVQNLTTTSASRQHSTFRSITQNNLLTYDHSIGSHSLNVLLGQEMYEYRSEGLSGSRRSFPIPGVTEPVLGSELSAFSGSSDLRRMFSVFSRLEYSFMERYNASFSLRRDGSSRFHPDNQWGTFYAVGASWNIHRESFMTSLQGIVDLLKLRVSYGSSGNENVSTFYAYQNIYSSNRITTIPGIAPASLGNPNLRWEANVATNIGVDFALLKNRLRGSVEYFSRISNDLIYSMPLAGSSGYTSYLDNVGATRNSGIELEVKGLVVNHRNFKWDLGVNMTHLKNEITDFPRDEVVTSYKRLKKGSDMYAFYLKEWAGMTKVNEQLYTRNNAGQIEKSSNSKGGEPTWYLVDPETGKKYKTNNAGIADRKDVGSSLPDLYGGVTSEMRFFNFNISALLSYRIGGKIYAGGTYTGWFGTGTVKARPFAAEMVNRWSPSNQDSDLPRLSTKSPTYGWGEISTRHLYDGSYARLKNLTVAYKLPKSLLGRMSITSADLFVQGENLVTLFGLDGLEPEIGGFNGITGYNYPISKVFSVGVKLGF